MNCAQQRQRERFIFTSESVSEGHPDKVCDQISDAILDAFLTQNPFARGAIEVLATTNHLTIAGEYRGVVMSRNEINEVAHRVVRDIGYAQQGFSWNNMQVINLLHEQSADIAMGVDASSTKDEGAGDQGIMFGFACDETPTFMPAPICYANAILKKLSEGRHAGLYPELGPDAKSQVSLVYEHGVPVRAASIVVSTQHRADVQQHRVREIVLEAIRSVFPKDWMCDDREIYINPTGQFIIGGPDGDAGLTGRKIIVDSYGGAAPHGGGAFSGKDPTKVDRSAAYAARYLAKNVVAAGLAKRCTIQISYAIGIAHPLSFYVNTEDTALVDEAALERILPEMVNLSPRGIREHLQLNRPIYQPTASYGHFGREYHERGASMGAFSWEQLDLVEALQGHFNIGAAKRA
ncbi:MAG: methionine adenosyltransferase [Alphaproteobacteria bacterium]|nr:MAG: methionine adenosyltransferase [Alphaproteobacteria bacterium]